MSEPPCPPSWPGVGAVWHHPLFRAGLRDMLKLSPGIGAWGLVTGVAMVKLGLHPAEALLMSLLVYAGSAQLAALPLMLAGAPWWVVVAACACVNLRFAVFSIQWRPFLLPYGLKLRLLLGYLAGDVSFGLFMSRFGGGAPPGPVRIRRSLPYFLGLVGMNWLAWQVSSVAGIVLGARLPEGWGLEFAGVMALLAVALTLMKDRRTVLAAAVASLAALLCSFLPLRLNILVALVAAVGAGWCMERGWRQKAKPGRSP